MHHGTGRFHARASADSSAIPTGDRRQTPRYELKLAITLHGENNFYAGLSENLSEGGVFIATSQPLPIGTPVVLEFTLPTSPVALSLFGVVQWVRGPDATASQYAIFGGGTEVAGAMPGIGVKFVDVDPVSAEAIRAFMQKREPVFFDA
jgi:uncharacterized protein (TIGR02266 family)